MDALATFEPVVLRAVVYLLPSRAGTSCPAWLRGLAPVDWLVERPASRLPRQPLHRFRHHRRSGVRRPGICR